MSSPPPWNQFPGLPDSQVGISDLGTQSYPWSQPARDQQESYVTSPCQHPLQLESSAANRYQRLSSNYYNHDHGISVSEFPASPSPQFDDNVPTNPPPENGHMLLPSGTWVWRPSSAHPNQLPPISALDFGQQFPHAGSPGENCLPPLGHQPRLESTPSQVNGHSPRLPPLEDDIAHMNGQQQAPHEGVQEFNREQNMDPEFGHDTFAPVCEFSKPCHMGPSPDGTHFRKIVSHLFGRNKASTKLFPEWVWVWYCRKHYQRARYRAEQWPFTQCELLLQSLERMETWGYVQSFELRLRRREALRTDGQGEKHAPTGLLRNGRRHPTAITAPVPEWLQREIGKGKTFGEIRGIVKRIREYLASIQHQEDSKIDTQTKSNGVNMTKEEKKLRQNATYRERNSLVRFPDVEILPTFHPEVVEQARRRAAQKKHGGQAERNDDQEEDVGEMDDNCDNDLEEKATGTSHDEGRQKNGQKSKMTTRISDHGAIKKPVVKKPNSKKK